MYAKILSWRSGTADLEQFYSGLRLKYYSRNNILNAYLISGGGQPVGYCEFAVLPDSLRMYQLQLKPDFFGQGIGTAMLNYLRDYATGLGRKYLTFCTHNYAFLLLTQTKMPADSLCARNPFLTKWRPLAQVDILRENRVINAYFKENGRSRELNFIKDIFGRWKCREQFILYIERSCRIQVFSKEDKQAHNAQFYVSRSYELKIPVRDK